nr:hypothetical protein GCM10010200_036860 [Actinomadura rugatobispora]
MLPSNRSPSAVDLADGHVFPDLNGPQSLGRACVVCYVSFVSVDRASVPEHVVVGRSGSTGLEVSACVVRCAPLVGYVAPVGEQEGLW